MPEWLFYYFIGINAFAFLLCMVDKLRALKRHKRGIRRIPERDLWLCAVIGGCFGLYLGMIVFCHKVAKRRFVWGMSLLCAVYFGLWLYYFSAFWR